MKIVMISPTYPDRYCGVSTYTQFLIDELQEWVEVKVYGKDLYKKYPVSFKKEIENSTIIHAQLAISNFGYMGLKVFPLYNHLAFFRKPVVTTIHELPLMHKSFLKGFIADYYFKFIFHFVAKQSDALIVHNENSKGFFIDSRIGHNIRIVPHGTSVKQDSKEKTIRHTKGVIGLFGFINENKGIHRILKILPQLPNIKFIVAGIPKSNADKIYYDDLINLSKNLQITDRVSYVGYLPDDNLVSFFESVDFLVFPYSTITASGTLHLALANKVACLVSNIPTFHELYQRYGCVEEFDLESEVDLLNQIKDLMWHPEKRMQIIQNQINFIADTSWNQIALKTYELYKTLL